MNTHVHQSVFVSMGAKASTIRMPSAIASSPEVAENELQEGALRLGQFGGFFWASGRDQSSFMTID